MGFWNVLAQDLQEGDELADLGFKGDSYRIVKRVEVEGENVRVRLLHSGGQGVWESWVVPLGDKWVVRR